MPAPPCPHALHAGLSLLLGIDEEEWSFYARFALERRVCMSALAVP